MQSALQNSIRSLAEGVRGGDVRALARAITLVENAGSEAEPLLAALFPHAGGSLVLGVTGPPGVGKSTLVDGITSRLRQAHKSVGIVAIDPTSPFSGGAILGDRIRMQAHAVDPGVFIRSMATRGHLGGLAVAATPVIELLAASGKDVILVETVGVGQDEVEIVETADVCIVVLVPGLGDEVQALKAGLMEIGDVFVINKADRDGADALEAQIQMMASLGGSRRPGIVKTVATTGAGIEALLLSVERFREEAQSSGTIRTKRREQLRRRFETALKERLMHEVRGRALSAEDEESTVDRLARREVDPFTAAKEVVRKLGLKGGFR